MSTDRELLEAAAGAAGLKIHTARQAERDDAGHGSVGLWLANGCTCWNPLTDDGDALRLAVARDIAVSRVKGQMYAIARFNAWSYVDIVDGDRAAAARRAITEVAARLAQEPPCPKT